MAEPTNYTDEHRKAKRMMDSRRKTLTVKYYFIEVDKRSAYRLIPARPFRLRMVPTFQVQVHLYEGHCNIHNQ